MFYIDSKYVLGFRRERGKSRVAPLYFFPKLVFCRVFMHKNSGVLFIKFRITSASVGKWYNGVKHDFSCCFQNSIEAL